MGIATVCQHLLDLEIDGGVLEFTDRSFKQPLSQKLQKPRSPLLPLSPEHEAALFAENAKLVECLSKSGNTFTRRGHCFQNRWTPPVLWRRHRQHRDQLLLDAVGSGAVRLVDHKQVGNLHDPGLEGLYI